jgi:hypothetical protein
LWGRGFCPAAGLIVDPKERGSKRGFPQPSPPANVEISSPTPPTLSPGWNRRVSFRIVNQGRHPAVTSSPGKRATFCGRFPNRGMRFVSMTNSQVSSGSLKTTISFSGRQSPPAETHILKGEKQGGATHRAATNAGGK